MRIFRKIKALSVLDFAGRGEAFVETNFLTPLLECLGYDEHDDYEVRRHGDEGTSFRLYSPPVEHGSRTVRHYNPDYMPTIRKKTFWIIEAKSPRSVAHPFRPAFIVQGLQYCIHPEIQAKYLVLSNGTYTSIYDPQATIFFGEDPYKPIFSFAADEIIEKWDDIYDILGVEKLRTRIEDYLKAHYEKLCLSSLDQDYPLALARKITKEQNVLTQQIQRHVSELHIEALDKEYHRTQHEFQNLPRESLKDCMNYPLTRGKPASVHYVERLLVEKPLDSIFPLLISGFQDLSYFQKQHTMVAVCRLHNLTEDPQLKNDIRAFVVHVIADEIPLLNQAECALLRLIRKIIIIGIHPIIRESISQCLYSIPEIERFVDRPAPRNWTYVTELAMHDYYFGKFSDMDSTQLGLLTECLLEAESKIEGTFVNAWRNLPDEEKEIDGFENCGRGDKMYTLGNIAKNSGIISQRELDDLYK